MSNVVVLVTNRKYLRRCLHTVWQLRRFGDYDGDVVVIVGSDLKLTARKLWGDSKMRRD